MPIFVRYRLGRVERYLCFFLEVHDVMARSRKDGDVGPEQGGFEPPCMDSGDDRPGAQGPSWVLPNPADRQQGYLAARDEEFRKRWPTIFDFLSLTGLQGKQRRTGTILVFLEDNRWKCCINDRDGGYYAFLSADAFSPLLDALEVSLKGGGLEWRLSKPARRG